MFKFKPEVAPHVANLCWLLQFANASDSRGGGKWSSKSGIYGASFEALKKIIAVECGEDIAARAVDLIDFGANLNWFDDVCVAIAEAYEQRREEEATTN